MSQRNRLAIMYIYLAAGSGILGAIFIFATLVITKYYAIDLARNWWIMLIPVFLSLVINILLVELYRKLANK